MFDNKYNMTRQESIFFAKKKWDENIYCGMKMENRNVTFPETKTILDGINVGRVSLDDIQSILNMRDAWKYVIQFIDKPLNLLCLCNINSLVSRNESLEWGVLRDGEIGISGTNYKPDIPNNDKIHKEFNDIINNNASDTEKALDIFTWGSRSQLFWDGNKRTSLLAANKLLVSCGHGLLTIKDVYMDRFNSLLATFYETNNNSDIKKFLYQHAIDGIERKKEYGLSR